MAETAFPETSLEFGVFDWIESSAAAPAEIFEHKLQIAETADAAGFRGWHLAEHQGTPLSIDGAPSLMIAAAAQRTRRLRLGALTWCLPWYNPYRFYSEIHHLTRQRDLPDLMRNMDPTSPDAVQRLVAGTPNTVVAQLADIVRDSGANYLLLVFSFGDLALECAMRSMRLFVREVMPALRSA